MKIGDKVSFLNDVGGGKIAGFQGKNIVLVEDADGFQIPTDIHDVVVVEEDNYNTSNMIAQQRKASASAAASSEGSSVKKMMQEGMDDTASEPDSDPADKPVTYSSQPQEREQGNRLFCYLAFVPLDINHLPDSRFEVYLVNDCNYYIQCSLLTSEGQIWTLRHSVELEPNTKEFIDEIGFADLDSMSHVCVQMLSYKRDKPFVLKPMIDVRFRISAQRFYKFGSFTHNIFFEQPALIFKLVEDDKPLLMSTVSATQLKEQMMSPSTPSSAQQHRQEPVSRYDEASSKGNKKHSPYYKYRGLDDAVVVDLHADEVLETTSGMSSADILQYQLKVFRDILAKFAGKKGQKIVFIHGKGAGTLRRAIINELQYRYKQYPYQDASFLEYGYGATQVTIK